MIWDRPFFHAHICGETFFMCVCVGQARQTRPNSGGLQRASQDSTITFTFYPLKSHFLEFLRYAIKKGLLLRILCCKNVPFLEFLREAIKTDSHLRIFTL